MKKYYHVSLDLSGNPNKIFTPRIPMEKNRLKSEDFITPRICVSETIAGCLSSAPFGGYNILELYNDFNISCPIRVFVFYEEDIKSENFISSETLYTTDKVRDALYTEECWIINQDIAPRESFVIVLKEIFLKDVNNISYENLKKCENDKSINEQDYVDGYFTIVNGFTYKLIDEYTYTDTISMNVNLPVFEEKIIRKLTNYFSYLEYGMHCYEGIEFIEKTVKVKFSSKMNVSLTHIKEKFKELGLKVTCFNN